LSRRPPKKWAETGTLAGSSAVPSNPGLFALGAVNRLFACAAFRPVETKRHSPPLPGMRTSADNRSDLKLTHRPTTKIRSRL
jgi:hypothetical protein